MDIVLLGPPGAGKGTQAKRLEKKLGLPHIASGDIFRTIRRDDGPVSAQLKEYMDRGAYVPDELTIQLMLTRMRKPDAQNGFLLDGFPRTLPQARALDDALQTQERRVQVVLYITAPTDVLVSRICDRIVCPHCSAIYNAVTKPPTHAMICDVCGHTLERRTDEDSEVVRVRLETYAKQTKPLVEYYREKGALSQIDGSEPLADVNAHVDGAVGTATTP